MMTVHLVLQLLPQRAEAGASPPWYTRDRDLSCLAASHDIVVFFRLPYGFHDFPGVMHLGDNRGLFRIPCI